MNADESVRNRLADAAINIEVGRWMAYRVASMQGQGVVPNAEASMCKIILTESAQKLANTYFGCLASTASWDPGPRGKCSEAGSRGTICFR